MRVDLLTLPTSESDLLKAYGTGYWDYYFTDEGMVRIKMLSGLAYTTIVVIWAAVAAVLFPFPIAPWDLTNSVFLISVFISIVLIAITRRALSDRSRRKLSIFTPEQLAKSFKPIPWSSVESFNLKERNLTLRIDGTKYKMRVKKSDIEVIRQYVEAKAGGR